jgi:hypothetical protein
VPLAENEEERKKIAMAEQNARAELRRRELLRMKKQKEQGKGEL